MELRNRIRYRLSADVAFVWRGPRNQKLLGEGMTRDISVAGAFVFTRTCPPVGAKIELQIFLARPNGNNGRAVQIKTEAQVIRVDHSANTEGFAAVSQDFTLLFDHKGPHEVSVSSAMFLHKGLASA